MFETLNKAVWVHESWQSHAVPYSWTRYYTHILPLSTIPNFITMCVQMSSGGKISWSNQTTLQRENFDTHSKTPITDFSNAHFFTLLITQTKSHFPSPVKRRNFILDFFNYPIFRTKFRLPCSKNQDSTVCNSSSS